MADIIEKTMVEKKTKVGMRCTICKKEERDQKLYDEWFSGAYWHHGWGDNWGDSQEFFDLCSAECFMAALVMGLNSCEDYKDSAEIFRMSFRIADELHKMLEAKNDG